MPNKNYIAGRNAEYKTMRTLENKGYYCSRTSGSHGIFDVIAINGSEVRLIQVKRSSGSYKISDEDKEAFKDMSVGQYVKKEVWLFQKGNNIPIIEEL